MDKKQYIKCISNIKVGDSIEIVVYTILGISSYFSTQRFHEQQENIRYYIFKKVTGKVVRMVVEPSYNDFNGNLIQSNPIVFFNLNEYIASDMYISCANGMYFYRGNNFNELTITKIHQ